MCTTHNDKDSQQMSVKATHPQYDKNAAKWKLVRDVVEAQDLEDYLYDVCLGDNLKPDEVKRNEVYKERAVFTNFTGRTKVGLVGAAFLQPPTIELPNAIAYLEDDATGNKQSLSKLAKECIGEVLQFGRYGLLVDYPATEPGLTADQVSARNLAARIYKYKAEAIINWDTKIVDGNTVLSLVVLQECTDAVGEDGFSWKEQKQYRVLRLVNGVYEQWLFDEYGKYLNDYTPRKKNGQTWNYIPFFFIGGEDNDTVVDTPPLFDLATLNIAHYRNSADYEDFLHILSQPSLIISSTLSQEEWEAFNPNGFQYGSRKGHNIGPNSSAQLLQPNPTQVLSEAMKQKEEQAVMIGARLITQAASNETAESARIKHSSETSMLINIVDNVEDALVNASVAVLEFMSDSADKDQITFVINKEFFVKLADPVLLSALLQNYINEVIPMKIIRDYLRERNVINKDLDDEELDELISNQGIRLGIPSSPFQQPPANDAQEPEESEEPEEPGDPEDDNA